MEHFESRDDKIEEPEEDLEQLRQRILEHTKDIQQTEGIENQHLQELGFTEDALEPYYAGLVASDGHIEPDTNRSVFASDDLEFVASVVEPVIEEQDIKYSEFWDDGAGVYKVSIYNEELWDTLTDKYNIPPGEKAEAIEPPEGLVDQEKLWYVRGWFDGEGWSEEMTKEYEDTEYHYPRVGFKVMSEDIRDWVAEELEERDIRVSTYNREDGSHGLWINGYEECRKFDEEIGFRHPEQDERLKELLANWESRSEARDTG